MRGWAEWAVLDWVKRGLVELNWAARGWVARLSVFNISVHLFTSSNVFQFNRKPSKGQFDFYTESFISFTDFRALWTWSLRSDYPSLWTCFSWTKTSPGQWDVEDVLIYKLHMFLVSFLILGLMSLIYFQHGKQCLPKTSILVTHY